MIKNNFSIKKISILYICLIFFLKTNPILGYTCFSLLQQESDTSVGSLTTVSKEDMRKQPVLTGKRPVSITISSIFLKIALKITRTFENTPKDLIFSYKLSHFVDVYKEENTKRDKPSFWEVLPFDSAKEEKINSPHIISALLYEFFGYKTSEPRIGIIREKRSIIRKRMDENRGYKIIYPPFNNMTIPHTFYYKQLRIVASFLGGIFNEFSILQNPYDNKEKPTYIVLNDFFSSLQFYSDFYSTDSMMYVFQPLNKQNIREIMEAIDINIFPLDHPWRNFEKNDIEQIIEAFKKLKDRTIDSFIRYADFSRENIDFATNLSKALKENRDIIIKELEKYLNEEQKATSDAKDDFSQIQPLIEEFSDFKLKTTDELSTYLDKWVVSEDKNNNLNLGLKILKNYAEGKNFYYYNDIDNLIKIFIKLNGQKKIELNNEILSLVLKRNIELLNSDLYYNAKTSHINSISETIFFYALEKETPIDSSQKIFLVIQNEYLNNNKPIKGLNLFFRYIYGSSDFDTFSYIFNNSIKKLIKIKNDSLNNIPDIIFLSFLNSILQETRHLHNKYILPFDNETYLKEKQSEIIKTINLYKQYQYQEEQNAPQPGYTITGTIDFNLLITLINNIKYQTVFKYINIELMNTFISRLDTEDYNNDPYYYILLYLSEKTSPPHNSKLIKR